MTTAEARARGRESYDRRAWGDAFAELSAADRQAPLEPEDLGRLATAAYLVGRDEDSIEVWERARIANFWARATSWGPPGARAGSSSS